MNEVAVNLLWMLGTRGPIFVVCIVGLIYALTHSRQGPGAALLTAVVCGLLLIGDLVMMVVYTFLPGVLVQQQNMRPESIATVYRGLSFVWGLFHTAGLAGLVGAVFMGRSTAPPATGPEYAKKS